MAVMASSLIFLKQTVVKYSKTTNRSSQPGDVKARNILAK